MTGSGDAPLTEGRITAMYRAMRASIMYERLVVRRSPIHGWGLFLRQDMPKDTIIIEYTGPLVRQPVADRREILYEEAARLNAWSSDDYEESKSDQRHPSVLVPKQNKRPLPVAINDGADADEHTDGSPASASAAARHRSNKKGGLDLMTLFGVPVAARRSDGSGSCYLFRLDENFIVDATVRN
jgi:hypothetical protein